MITAIKFSEKSNASVKVFNALSIENKVGGYWESEDENLKFLKSEIKNFYLAQQDYTCAYCQQKIVVAHNGAWDTEHIIAKSTHPQFMFTPQNLCVACKDCNTEKTAKNVLANISRKTFPRKSEDYLITHPHFDEFSHHVRLLPHSLFFMPKTKKGIKTIETCGLMRFILAYADYGVNDTQLKKEIALRHQLLQDTSDPGETMILIAEIEELMEKLKKIARENGMIKMKEKKKAA